MGTAHFNFYPPAGSVIDQRQPRAQWNGRAWTLNGRRFRVRRGDPLVGRPGGPLAGWYFDWQRGAWIEPARPQPMPRPMPGGMVGPVRRVGPVQQPMPTMPMPMPMAMPMPTNPPAQPAKEEKMMEKKEQNVLEYLVKHPVAPLVGGVVLLGSVLADEPMPPQIPEDLPEPIAKQWQMIYAQNLQRFQRRMALWENVGKVLLGYADTNAILAALPPKKM